MEKLLLAQVVAQSVSMSLLWGALGTIVGMLGTYLLLNRIAGGRLRDARKEAERAITDGNSEAEVIRKTAQVEARQQLRVRRRDGYGNGEQALQTLIALSLAQLGWDQLLGPAPDFILGARQGQREWPVGFLLDGFRAQLAEAGGQLLPETRAYRQPSHNFYFSMLVP